MGKVPFSQLLDSFELCWKC